MGDKKNKKYDVVVVDPPAFVKSKNEKKDALEGYLNLNTLAIKLLKKKELLLLHHVLNTYLITSFMKS